MIDSTPPDETHTCDHPYHSQYWDGHLPPLLFRLDPPIDREHGPVEDLEEDGEVVIGDDGAPIRDFPFLPRYISSNPPTWLLEFWMRTDSRLTYRDIKARMTAPRDEQPTENALNMRREREVRAPLGLSCWAARRGRTSRVSRIDLERMERWTYDQIHMNTTMEIEYRFTHGTAHPAPFRLRSKSLALEPAPDVYYPLDTFLEDSDIHEPSERTITAMDTFFVISERARSRGLDSWRRLPASDIPVAWKPYAETPRPASANIVDVQDEEDYENEDEDEEDEREAEEEEEEEEQGREEGEGEEAEDEEEEEAEEEEGEEVDEGEDDVEATSDFSLAAESVALLRDNC